jgi:hypothetical protein
MRLSKPWPRCVARRDRPRDLTPQRSAAAVFVSRGWSFARATRCTARRMRAAPSAVALPCGVLAPRSRMLEVGGTLSDVLGRRLQAGFLPGLRPRSVRGVRRWTLPTRVTGAWHAASRARSYGRAVRCGNRTRRARPTGHSDPAGAFAALLLAAITATLLAGCGSDVGPASFQHESPVPQRPSLWKARAACSHNTSLMLIIAVTAQKLEGDLAAGLVACPDCGAQLSRWGYGRSREVRMAHGTRELTPRRTICTGCETTHVLCPCVVAAATRPR